MWQSTATELSGGWRASTATEAPQHYSECASVVIDGAEPLFEDEEELLTHVGFAVASAGLRVAIVLPRTRGGDELYPLLWDMTAGLVSWRDAALGPLADALMRRTNASAVTRYEFVTVEPTGRAVLTISTAGRCELRQRPLEATDDGSAIANIELNDDARCAKVLLATGRRLELRPNGSHHAVADFSWLGRRIKDLRARAGLTQADLARRTGIHRPNIARVRSGSPRAIARNAVTNRGRT